MKTRGFTLISEACEGFTLIELLVVIAVLGILATAVLVAINPLQKINQANDSKVKNDIGQIANAAQSYFVIKQTYPTTAQGTAQLVTANELTAVPAAPTGYTYTYTACGAVPCTAFSLSGTLKAPVTANFVWCYRSATGVAGELASASCTP